MMSPYFLIDADRIEANLKVLHGVMDHTGCKILLAQKCFSCYGLYHLVSKYLVGATASGLYEARLCHEEMPSGENHIFSPSYNDNDIDEILRICDHIVFNTPRQLSLYGKKAKSAGLQVGLRINPECSTQERHAIYDPCARGSRLGTRIADFENSEFMTQCYELPDGLHFHTLCEQNSDDLEITLDAVEDKFGKYLYNMKWLNFGGGHHITRKDYDINRLERCICKMQDRYGLQVYLEPGEAVALNAGELHCNVLEIQPIGEDGINNVILTTSAACHMPDVLEMPYTPPILTPKAYESHAANGSHSSDKDTKLKRHCYRLGGPTCLSGDIIGTYYFENDLKEGDEIVFGDMAIYSMVKTNTFNGMPLPDINIKQDGEIIRWKHFSYDDFKCRL